MLRPQSRRNGTRPCRLCEKPVHARGLCTMHYKREWRQENGEAVERDREWSRRYKREALGQPGLPRGAKP